MVPTIETIPLERIELDTTIQCRASIDTAVVSDYAERMESGDEFPPIEVYGTRDRCWIGDGWHRVLAARQRGEASIAGILHPGLRVDALRHALGANSLHGLHRSNADKRRCVEIALKEFPKLSSRAIAKMCGVSDKTVEAARPTAEIPQKRTGQDGKERATRRDSKRGRSDRARCDPTDEKKRPPKLGPPADGMDFARMAIMDLEQIQPNDKYRTQAFESVEQWIVEHR